MASLSFACRNRPSGGTRSRTNRLRLSQSGRRCHSLHAGKMEGGFSEKKDRPSFDGLTLDRFAIREQRRESDPAYATRGGPPVGLEVTGVGGNRPEVPRSTEGEADPRPVGTGSVGAPLHAVREVRRGGLEPCPARGEGGFGSALFRRRAHFARYDALELCQAG